MASQRVSNLIELLAAGRDDATAITAPDLLPLSYAALRALVSQSRTALNGMGIGRSDRVAIVLPNGPEMATSFIAVASCATAAPLNPTYKADEFEFYMSDLHAKALLVEEGSSSPAVAVAEKLGVRVLTLRRQSAAGAGAFELIGEGGGDCLAGPAEANDIALVLHTSGTTSRPKIVPLSHRNVSVSAGNIAETLELGPADSASTSCRCSTSTD